MPNEIDDIVLCPMPRQLQRTDGTSASSKVVETTDATLRPEEYQLDITRESIAIRSSTPAGQFHAQQTLKQLRRQFGNALPCLQIRDWPDFPARGVMLDISRAKVPTMATLRALIDMLAEWKINQVQLYIEHTFAYRGHETVWKNASPMTPEEIRQLDDYCRERFIEFVPNQNSFGHMERWLAHPEYIHLAEAPDGADTPWGFRWDGPFSLNPTDPKSLELLKDLYAQFLPYFRSKFFNVGCDETFDIGQGRSKAQADKVGVTRVYIDFLKKVHELVKSHGRTMMFWGDIILHKPEMISELPKDAIGLNWGYSANHPFDKEGEAFERAGMAYYVCPGTSSWNTISGRTDNTIKNTLSAAENGLKHGAIGYLNTDWGDYGHIQYQPISYLGFLTGAAYSWCLESNRSLPIARALDLHAFHCTRGSMGKIAYELGTMEDVIGKRVGNATVPFQILTRANTAWTPLKDLQPNNLQDALNVIDSAMAGINDVKLDLPDAQLVIDEYKNTAELLRWACVRGIKELDGSTRTKVDPHAIMTEHQRLWMARNRPGGMNEGLAHLKRAAQQSP